MTTVISTTFDRAVRIDEHQLAEMGVKEFHVELTDTREVRIRVEHDVTTPIAAICRLIRSL